MTIGIAAFGSNAGAAVLAAWDMAEIAGSGSIGGFAVFAVLTDAGNNIAVECQRGGLTTIRQAGLPAEMARAQVAAVITSGPDRPLPLSQFLTSGKGGLVTGHRLPNLIGVDNLPLNIAALRLIEGGIAPQHSVETVCNANPTLDAGLIAVTRTAIGVAETAWVQKRDDRGQMRISEPGRALALLHNSIDPVSGFAERVARAGMAGFG